MKKLTALLITVCILFCGCTAKRKINIKNDNITEEKTESNQRTNAIWLTYTEIAYLCKDTTEKQFREKIIDLAANLLSFKINTLIVHAVAFCDSFYESGFLPESGYVCTNEEYDVFGIICEICSSVGIKTEAWINPYRVSSKNDLTVIKENNAIKKLYSENKKNILVCKNEIYLNPAETDVQRFILDEAREIITKYPVWAIHIDDYFYPDMTGTPDKSSYGFYKKNDGTLSLNDWRRENVNSLISSLHLLVSSFGKRLSVSPAAGIEMNYETKYADIAFWLENGWVDEIIPQLYFGFENENAPFETKLDEWINLTEKSDVSLVIGLAFYKCGNEDAFAGKGKNEWKENCDIIARQIRLIRQKSTTYGVSFFSYSHIFGKNMKKIAKKELQNAKSVI